MWLGFISANTRATQGSQSVNSVGAPEVPRIVWEELVANALIHRDYFVSAPVRLLVFAGRVEIISPGHLPNNLTIENIKAGNSNIRNPILASFAAKPTPRRKKIDAVKTAPFPLFHSTRFGVNLWASKPLVSHIGQKMRANQFNSPAIPASF